jgi:hypothetical protein
MSKNRLQNSFLLISGMIGLLLLAFILDLVVRSMLMKNVEGAGLESILVWLYPLFSLLWMLAALFLIRHMFVSLEYGRVVCIILLVISLPILYGTSLLFVLPVPQSFYQAVEFLSPGTFLFTASAFTSAASLISLFLWKEPEAEKESEPLAAEPPVAQLEPEDETPL